MFLRLELWLQNCILYYIILMKLTFSLTCRLFASVRTRQTMQKSSPKRQNLSNKVKKHTSADELPMAVMHNRNTCCRQTASERESALIRIRAMPAIAARLPLFQTESRTPGTGFTKKRSSHAPIASSAGWFAAFVARTRSRDRTGECLQGFRAGPHSHCLRA